MATSSSTKSSRFPFNVSLTPSKKIVILQTCQESSTQEIPEVFWHYREKAPANTGAINELNEFGDRALPLTLTPPRPLAELATREKKEPLPMQSSSYSARTLLLLSFQLRSTPLK